MEPFVLLYYATIFLLGLALGWYIGVLCPRVRKQESEQPPLYTLNGDYSFSKAPPKPEQPRLSREDNERLRLLRQGLQKRRESINWGLANGYPDSEELWSSEISDYKRRIAALEAKGVAW